MPQVRVIQPISEQAKKLRVAAYARVSSDSADQLNSLNSRSPFTKKQAQRNAGSLGAAGVSLCLLFSLRNGEFCAKIKKAYWIGIS